MNEKWLIRLFDSTNEHLLAAYFTELPSENLKTFYFCREHGIGIKIPRDLEKETDKEGGSICEIEVGFGDKGTYSHIDVWLENVY